MQKRFSYLILPLMFSLTACASSNGDQTLVAQNEALGTQIAFLYGTATVDADHLIVTLESAQAQQTNAQNQNRILVGTLVARNFDPTALAMFTPQGNLAFAPEATNINTGQQSGATIVVPTPQGARETSTPPPSQIQPETTEAVASSSGASLLNPVMSTGVGSDDCAVGSINQFSAANPEIYVVAMTQGIRAGMNLLSRWYLNGVEQISHDFAPESDIPDGRCVWFFIDQGEIAFTSGNWSVQLEVDGVPVSTAQFTIAP